MSSAFFMHYGFVGRAILKNMKIQFLLLVSANILFLKSKIWEIIRIFACK